jgi:hypothetical protein
MNVARKSRIVSVALLAVALWPVVQMVLVRRYDVSPWKLAGWGMYATPRFGMVGMEVYGRSSSSGDWQQLVAPSPGVRDAATAFLEQHRWLRRLASSRELAGLVRAERPEWRQIRIAVSYPVLDPASGMVRLTSDERVDPRDDG